MSNLSYFMLTDQEKTVINQTHVDWFGYGVDTFIEHAPLLFFGVFLMGLMFRLVFELEGLKWIKENPEIRQLEPKISSMVFRILTYSLLFTIVVGGFMNGVVSYYEVVRAQSYAAQSYATVRQPADDKDTDKKLVKHGFKVQDILQETNRVETYDVVPGTLKKEASDGKYKNVEPAGDSKGSCGTWGYYKADIIVGYVGSEPKTKEYEWRSYDSCDQNDTSVKYAKATTPNQKPTLRVTYQRVEDIRYRSVPNAVDTGYSYLPPELFYLDTDTVYRSREHRERVEVVVPVG